MRAFACVLNLVLLHRPARALGLARHPVVGDERLIVLASKVFVAFAHVLQLGLEFAQAELVQVFAIWLLPGALVLPFLYPP